jgi:DNA-binding transcriptional MerR regulator
MCNNTVMVIEHTTTLTLEQLSEEVARQLEQNGLMAVQQDHRVSAAPDIRTIRYYTTLGLLDRPIIEGRQARYNKRHLLQLLGIKALQVLSLPLSEIQSRLYGLSDSELESVVDSVSSSVKDAGSRRGEHDVARPAVWREIVIAPGLKLMAEENWQPTLDDAGLLDRIRAALFTLRMAIKKANGGTKDEYSGT